MSSLPYRLVPQIGTSGRVGLIVLRADETIEAELRRLWPEDDAALFISRIPSGAEVSGETLAAMEAELPRAAGLLPQDIAFDVVGYACTSAASVIGAARVAELVRQGCQTAQVTDPVTALIAACRDLGVSRLALLSPYTEPVSETLRQVLAQAGIETPVFGSFNEAVETKVARIDPASIRDAAVRLGQDSAVEAVFMSCTNLRTQNILDSVAQLAGKPAMSSNQVLFRALFRAIGV